MSESYNFLKKLFTENKKSITDDAITELENFLDFVGKDLNNISQGNDKDGLKYVNALVKQACLIAEDGRRTEVIKEDIKIMFMFPKDDMSIAMTPIKALIDENCEKKINKEGAKHLASELDTLCIEILNNANVKAKVSNHPTITIDDLQNSL